MTRDSGRTATVSLSGSQTLAYTTYGAADGTPVLFLHGTPGSRRLGTLFDAVARSNGVRLLAVDRPGYGRSTPRPGRSVGDADRFVAAVVDDVGVDTASVVAFSGGAPYALASAAALPGRIDRLDIVAGATPPRVTGDRPVVQRLAGGMATTTPRLLRGAFRAQAWLARRRDPSFVTSQYTAGDASETVPEQAAAVVREDFLEAFARYRSGAVTEFRHTMSEWDVDFGEIETEVRLWHGTADTNVPIAAVRRLESILPTAHLRVLDGADHLQTLLDAVPQILEDYR
ncbi:alpha/beta fold hydrolase [Halobellus rufus]|uniref:alpha/beta fold hydrolase n=1 Tax=Halobellus rufus TaxID=1448860 RepID=UPI001E3DF618|nr:alpha/beta hydrolase [Halobellus rufus]